MRSFSYFAPTEIVFGEGCASRLGEFAARYGRRALLVTGPSDSPRRDLYNTAVSDLRAAGLEVAHFDGVIPNPTTKEVSCGAALAREFSADVVIGLGGGSAMDTAKAIAAEASHPGTAWDYLHNTAGPTEKTLPILAVPTTAGTGSQTTPCAVITRTQDKDKSAIWNKNIFPRAALVDPILTSSMPPHITALTGFDAFCHNFEAYLSVHANPLSDAMAIDAIGRIAAFLPAAVRDGTDREARAQMAWADTIGGLTNAAAGVTLPHGLGMQVGGHCPHVAHGAALAALYPAFTRFTWRSAVQKFAVVGRILNPRLADADDETAARGCCDAIDGLLKEIGLWTDFASLGVSRDELREIADCGQVLGDYQNNPRIASIEEMYELLLDCFERPK